MSLSSPPAVPCRKSAISLSICNCRPPAGSISPAAPRRPPIRISLPANLPARWSAPSNSGTTIEATDFASNPPTLVNGDGLLAVNYSIPANTSGTFNLTLVTTGANPTALDDQNANPISFTVQDATLTVVPSTVYWNGGTDANWNTLSGTSYVTNWSTTSTGFTDAHALPGANTDVNFTTSGGGSNLSTTLGANFSIKGLTFTVRGNQPRVDQRQHAYARRRRVDRPIRRRGRDHQ